MFTVRQAAQLRYRLFIAMSMGEAKQLLGFPPGASPTPREINKAYKAKAKANHPDKGGETYKMVELNVAKDILDGKRVNDRTRIRRDDEPQEDPEVKRRREEEAREQAKREQAIRKITRIFALVQRPVEMFKNRMKNQFNSKMVEDLAGYLSGLGHHELANILDSFLDAADRALSGSEGKLSAKDEKAWRAAQREGEAIMGLALRVSKKFNELSVLVRSVEDQALYYYEIDTFQKAVPEFSRGFQALLKRSRKLMTIVNTTEAVPMWLADRLNKNHQMILAYEADFQTLDSFLKKDGAKLGKTIEDAVDVVIEALEDAGVSKVFPRWEDWGVPDDFLAAIELLKTPKTANVTMADRVASRAIIEQIRRQAASTSTPASSRSARTR